MNIISTNPVRHIYVKHTLHYLRQLMQATLTPLEDQLVMLHCGMYTRGRSVSFSNLARVFQLESPEAGKALYRQAVHKVRAAIPGSTLERWILCYHLAYYPGRNQKFHVAPDMPIPDWDTL